VRRSFAAREIVAPEVHAEGAEIHPAEIAEPT